MSPIIPLHFFFRHVVAELLATEQVYVEELRTVIEVNIC